MKYLLWWKDDSLVTRNKGDLPDVCFHIWFENTFLSQSPMTKSVRCKTWWNPINPVGQGGCLGSSLFFLPIGVPTSLLGAGNTWTTDPAPGHTPLWPPSPPPFPFNPQSSGVCFLWWDVAQLFLSVWIIPDLMVSSWSSSVWLVWLFSCWDGSAHTWALMMGAGMPCGSKLSFTPL